MISIISTYLSIAAMIVLTIFPVLVPAIITAGHAVIGRFGGPARAAGHQSTVERRLAAADA
jgi:hypothetical protein